MKWIYREILHNAEVDHGFFATLEDATRERERAIGENKVASGPFEVSDSYVLNEANGALARMRDVWDGKLFRGAKVKIKAPGGDLHGMLLGASGAEALRIRLDGETHARIFLASTVEVI